MTTKSVGAQTLETAWKRQAQWSNTANRLKRNYERWRLVVLFLATLAAILGVWSSQVASQPLTQALSALAAVAAALSPFVVNAKLTSSDLHTWVRARSASEAIKSAIYQYLTSGASNREKNLSEAQNKILHSVHDLSPDPRPSEPPRRAILADLSADDYLTKRVEEQINQYYLPTSARHTAAATMYKRIHLSLMLSGTVIGAANGVYGIPEVGPWIAVLSTIAAGVLAHLAAGRQEYLALSYHATADRLQDLRDEWVDGLGGKTPSSRAVGALVKRCEEVISNQNQDWHARLTQPNP